MACCLHLLLLKGKNPDVVGQLPIYSCAICEIGTSVMTREDSRDREETILEVAGIDEDREIFVAVDSILYEASQKGLCLCCANFEGKGR